MNINIFKMEIRDIQAVSLLQVKELGRSKGTNDILKDFNENKMSRYYVVKNDFNNIIAETCFWNTGYAADIMTICVDREYQGNKIATKLLNYVILEMFEENCVDITLEVRISNVKAIGLYKKLGFKIVTTRPNYYSDKEDAYLMHLIKDDYKCMF